ncbi:MAG: polyphosphate kinase 1 [Candidatus Kapaibacterium sp.]
MVQPKEEEAIVKPEENVEGESQEEFPEKPTDLYRDRELSWLSFNYRVLQEAKDQRVPLFERIKFLAIYSSNLDEFFRVRVASLRSLLRLRKRSRQSLTIDLGELIGQIRSTVFKYQEEIGSTYREEILPDLERVGIRILNESEVNAEQLKYLNEWFEEHLLSNLHATFLQQEFAGPFLHNRKLYLIVALQPRLARKFWSEQSEEEKASVPKSEISLAILEVPSATLGRFHKLPSPNGEHHVMFLDDILRLFISRIFPGFNPVDAWSVKLTRDAELYIDDEFAGDLLKKIRKGLRKREQGVPSRFLFDKRMPADVLKALRKGLELRKEDLVPGARYHNFSDFFTFPFPDQPEHFYPPMPPLINEELQREELLFDAISKKDYLFHFPYESYDPVIRFIREAAADPQVRAIAITLYRVASDSEVTKSLIQAAQNGKEVMAFVEVKARFDEESNLYWAGEMEKGGVRVLYSFPGLKVHSKICVVTRQEGDGLKRYAYLATGNFNERTSRIYCDQGLLTADERLTEETDRVFRFLSGEIHEPEFHHLLVAPFTLRKRLIGLIDREIEHAVSGRGGAITLKVNSLEDSEMIDKLYQASQAGVKIRLIVRGICCLRPGLPGLSQNIEAISIVDRFLEHARIYLFHNNGEEELYTSSADWMKRNLSRRVEVAFPIYNPEHKQMLRQVLEIQWQDNQHARWLDEGRENEYRTGGATEVRSQIALYEMLGGAKKTT